MSLGAPDFLAAFGFELNENFEVFEYREMSRMLVWDLC